MVPAEDVLRSGLESNDSLSNDSAFVLFLSLEDFWISSRSVHADPVRILREFLRTEHERAEPEFLRDLSSGEALNEEGKEVLIEAQFSISRV